MDAVRLRSAADSYQVKCVNLFCFLCLFLLVQSSRMAMISEKLQEMIGGSVVQNFLVRFLLLNISILSG